MMLNQCLIQILPSRGY